jgi:hypothetical protein
MRATAILGIIAIVAALAAVTLLIRTQEVSAQQSPSQIDHKYENKADLCGLDNNPVLIYHLEPDHHEEGGRSC